MGKRKAEVVESSTPGAPLKINMQMIQTITNYIRVGLTIQQAVEAAGISEPTYYSYLNYAMRSDADPTDLRSVLFKAARKAEEEARLRYMGAVSSGAMGTPDVVKEETRYDEDGKKVVTKTITKGVRADWRAAAWWLSYRDGRRSPQSKDVGPNIPGQDNNDHFSNSAQVQDHAKRLAAPGMLKAVKEIAQQVDPSFKVLSIKDQRKKKAE